MRLLDIINAPWAITPDMLNEIQGIYQRHMRGEKIDLNNLEARLGAPLNNEQKAYQVHDGVAVIQVDGVIAKRMNLFSKISGGVSTQLLQQDFESAMADRSVEAIVLAVDSPGGTVDGTPELARAIEAYRGEKPILACTDGSMCSAAYSIGAAADSINISSDVAMVGSIGVVAKHVDISKAEEKAGVKTTEITAGKYKRLASQHAPLSEEGRADIQEAVDHVYSVFVEDVARLRGTTVDDVLNTMADGRVFYGKKSIDAGLVDGVATLSETISQARAIARTGKNHSRAGVAQAHEKGATTMNIEQLKAEHPELVEAITAEARQGMVTADDLQTQIETATAAGAKAENERIAAVRAQSVTGHESLIEAMAFDGKSTAADVALAIVAAEQKKGEQALDAMDDDAPPVVPPADADEGKKQLKRSEFNALGEPERRAFFADGGKVID